MVMPQFCTKTSECTHSPLDKMAAISQSVFSNAFSWMKRFFYFDSNFTEVFPKGPIDNTSALVQVMVWRRTGCKPLPELIWCQCLTFAWRHRSSHAILCWRHKTSLRKTALGGQQRNERSMIIFHGLVCLEHKIACQKQNGIWLNILTRIMNFGPLVKGFTLMTDCVIHESLHESPRDKICD